MTGTARNKPGAMLMARALCAGLLMLALTACSPIYRNHGYVPSDTDLALLEVGRDTRETAGPKVGRPSTSGLLADTGWYFVQSRWEQKGAYPAVEIDRQVVALTFSEAGTLTNVEKFGIERGKVVALSRRVTQTNIKGISLLGQLFSSFGRIGAGQVLGN